MNSKDISRRKKFYIASGISIALMVIGIMISINSHGSFDEFISSDGNPNELANFMVGISYIASMWIIIFGLIFVPKNWKVVLILSILALPHIIMTIFMLEYNSLKEVIKEYIYFMSLGIIEI